MSIFPPKETLKGFVLCRGSKTSEPILGEILKVAANAANHTTIPIPIGAPIHDCQNGTYDIQATPDGTFAGICRAFYDIRKCSIDGVPCDSTGSNGRTLKEAVAGYVAIDNPSGAPEYRVLEDATGGALANADAGKFIAFAAGSSVTNGYSNAVLDSSSATTTSGTGVPLQLIAPDETEEAWDGTSARVWRVRIVRSCKI